MSDPTELRLRASLIKGGGTKPEPVFPRPNVTPAGNTYQPSEGVCTRSAASPVVRQENPRSSETNGPQSNR